MTADSPKPSYRQAVLQALRGEMPVLAVGGGFCLAFGWVWFGALLSRVATALPRVFSGTFLSGGGVSIFCVALVAGFVLNGFLTRPLAAWLGQPSRLPLFLHGEGLVCMAGGLLARNAAPPLAALLLGLAASGPGVYWTARLLGYIPPQAGMALAAATVLAWIMQSVCLASQAFFLMPIGLGLAMLLALLLPEPERKADDNGQPVFNPDSADSKAGEDGEADATTSREPGETKHARLLHITPFVVLALSFLALGITASAAPAPGGIGLLLSAAGMAAAVACCLWMHSDAVGVAVLTAAAVILTALPLMVFPGLSVISPFLWGFSEGAALVGLAALPAGGDMTGGVAGARLDFPRAGCYLAAVMVLVNGGGALGAAVIRWGDTGAGLFGLICLILLPALVFVMVKRRDFFPGWHTLFGTADAPGSSSSLDDVGQSPAPSVPTTLWPGLTPREQTVAELLLRDMTNPEICAALFISENTLRTHIKNLNHKTGATGREELKQLLRQGDISR